MINLITNLILLVAFFGLGAVQLNDNSQIIINKTMPKQIDDVIINQEAGGDISRETVYPTNKSEAVKKPIIQAASALVIDAKSGLVLFDKDSKTKRSIASITKLMTALVFLDEQLLQGDKLAWDQEIVFSQEDFQAGRRYLGKGEKAAIKDLFNFMLVGSANSETFALARATGLTQQEFVKKMNDKAVEFKMTNSRFFEPTGLDERNISTARDLAKLVYAAMQNQEIKAAITLPEYSFSPTNKKTVHKVNNTNQLLEGEWLVEKKYQAVGGKTGYIDQAGYNFVSQFSNDQGNAVISVVLKTDTLDHRFSNTKDIVGWSFASYDFD